MDRADVKNRGKNHMRSKARYKSNRFTKENTQLPPRQEVLPSNHDRYELSDTDDETVGADFALLANAPISIGGHFHFKNDATQELVDSSSKYLQTLDADLLSYSLRTIPFHVRCGIQSKYITEEHIEKLCQDAEKSKALYDEYLKQVENKENEDTKKCSSSSVHNESEKNAMKMKDIALSTKNFVDKNRAVDPERDELEDWLDDVLNS